MSQSSGFDMSKVPTGEKLVLGAAAIYIIWIFIPTWYSCCDVEGLGSIGNAGVNGFRGFMILAWFLALAAVAEIALRRFGSQSFNLPMKRSQLHVIVAAVALLCTLLGLVIKPSAFTVSASISWGLFVGIVLAIVWAYGAYMMYNAPEEASMGGTMGGSAPPPSPGPSA